MSAHYSSKNAEDNAMAVKEPDPSTPMSKSHPPDLDFANLSLLPHAIGVGGDVTDDDSISPGEQPYRLGRAPPPTLASAEPGVSDSPRSNVSEVGDDVVGTRVFAVRGTVTPKDQPIPTDGVAEGSKWADEVEHTMDRAFKMLKQLAEDDWKTKPEIPKEEHLKQRLEQMRRSTSELDEALKLVERDAYQLGKRGK